MDMGTPDGPGSGGLASCIPASSPSLSRTMTPRSASSSARWVSSSWRTSPSVTNDGRPKRWVVVRPPGAVTGLLLARADGEDQAAVVGRQAAGRVGFFLRVDDFGAVYARMASAGVQFVKAPRTVPYGRVAVFLDVAGNKWDLIGPATQELQL